MSGSNSSSHNNVDLSSLSKEDLLRFIAEQNRALKAKDEENRCQRTRIQRKKAQD